jgi:hypothetical protein
MRDRRGEGPERELALFYPRQRSRMAPVDEPEGAETHHQQTRADPDLALPIERLINSENGRIITSIVRRWPAASAPERRHEGARTFLHHSGRNRERPSQPGIHPVVEAACEDSQPESDDGPVDPGSVQDDG